MLVCVPMRSVQPFHKSVKQQCVPMSSDCVPYTQVGHWPLGHWSSSGGLSAIRMRSGCVPEQVRQGLTFWDIKGWRPPIHTALLSRASHGTEDQCVPYAFRATLPQKDQKIIVPVCVPMRSVQPFRKSVKELCVPMNSDYVPYAFLLTF